MAKISGSELRYRMTTLAMDVVGRDAAGFDPDAMSSTDLSRLQIDQVACLCTVLLIKVDVEVVKLPKVPENSQC